MLARSDRRVAAGAQLAVALVLLGACGGAASSRSSAAVTARTGSSPGSAAGTLPVRGTHAAAPPACVNGARSVCVTGAEQGRTITVHVGWRVVLDLRAPSKVWGVPQLSAGHVLAQAGPVEHTAGGIEVAYVAAHAGTASVHVTERPSCARGQVCPLFILLWQLHVHVTGG